MPARKGNVGKIPYETRKEIKERYWSDNITQTKLAEEYGLVRETVGYIVWESDYEQQSYLPRLCALPNCDRKHRNNSFCAKHDKQFRRTGSPHPKIQYNKVSKSDHPDIIKMYLSGLSCYKIAEKYPVSWATIRRILLRNNVPLRKNHATTQ